MEIRLISHNVILSIAFLVFNYSLAQVNSSIDSTTIKIGGEIKYTIQVETDSTDLVVFPEGQTFNPLEVIDSYDIDTLRRNEKYNLIKTYGLTQFDSGYYTIPQQKILIGDKEFLTDSVRVEVRDIVVDTTKQGLYDIKPLIEVKKSSFNWWKWPLIILLFLAFVGAVVYWFVWRKKPLTEEEKIALLSPYERAKLTLKNLDENHYLENREYKEYYSELTFAIRRYLDEQVYDHALESTTDQLIERLRLLRDAHKIELDSETITNIEAILRRADLVKFAKSSPDIELAKKDRDIIDLEIDHVKEAIPEPTEEEKLQDEQYREERRKRKKREKIVISVALVLMLTTITIIGFTIKYGFTAVKDTILGNNSKELLEGDWVSSAYGAPPIYIDTPEVLTREEANTVNPDQQLDQTAFSYGTLFSPIYITLNTTKVPQMGKQGIDINQVTEGILGYFEQNGVQNIITKTDKYTTPNSIEGYKIFGTADFPTMSPGNTVPSNYAIFVFSAEKVAQQIVLVWRQGDSYGDEIMNRVINSIELKKT
ncbi:BatD family protein [Aegicerativicinus sediminis]|uniref:BatD family protein n=1 Tax=Aegicerativicinus sediminis TaxID=2893202 RepID=UPI001E3569F6|nr:BatD family protein [Aegicerativicinus sediminis]